MHVLTFDGLGLDLTVRGTKSVLEAALEQLVEIRHTCGGLGMCTTCRVRVLAGGERLDSPTRAERLRLGPRGLEQGWRLACQTIVRGDLTIRLPPYS